MIHSTMSFYFVGADSCAVTVAVRVRPFAQREIADHRNRRVVSMEGCETIVRATGKCLINKLLAAYLIHISFHQRLLLPFLLL